MIDCVLFYAPRLITFHPAHKRVFAHPLRQDLLSRRESHSLSTPNATKLNSKLFGEKATQCQSKRRARRIPSEVIANTRTKRFSARRRTVARWRLRRDPYVQKGQSVVLDALGRVDATGKLFEVPRIDPWLARHWTWGDEDL